MENGKRLLGYVRDKTGLWMYVFHNLSYGTNGLRVSKVSGIGPGKLISWSDLKVWSPVHEATSVRIISIVHNTLIPGAFYKNIVVHC